MLRMRKTENFKKIFHDGKGMWRNCYWFMNIAIRFFLFKELYKVEVPLKSEEKRVAFLTD